MVNAVLQGVRFSGAQESHFQARKPSYMCSAVLKRGDLLMFRNCVFRMQNFQIWEMPSSKRDDFWCSGIAFIGCELFKFGQCRHARWSNYKCSRITFSGWGISDMDSAVLQGVFLLMLRNPEFRLRNVLIWAVQFSKGVEPLLLKNHDCKLQKFQIWAVRSCWCVGIAISGCETCRYEQLRLQGDPFLVAQKSRFQAAKRSDMCSAILLFCRFAES